MIVLVALLAGTAAGGLVVAVGSVLDRRAARVERRLAGYEGPEPVGIAVGDDDPGDPETRVVRSAVELTGDLAGRSGLLARTEVLLERADVALRPAEFLFYTVAFGFAAFVLVSLLVGVVAGLVVAALVVGAPVLWALRRERQRLAEFEANLPDTLQLLAGSLRAGFSFLQGVEAVAEESSGIMADELHRVFSEARLGRTIEDAFDDAAERMASKDLAWTVMAIRIQREVGGNLAELLDIVADTMRQRERLRREISTLTAEGRLSGIVLSIVPPALAAVLWVIQPDYIGRLFEDAAGIALVVVAALLTAVGWFWISRIVDIEV